MSFSSSGLPVPLASSQVITSGERIVSTPGQALNAMKDSPHHTQASPK